jgi:threonine dehydratase
VKRSDYLERILKARVYDVAIESPLELAPALSKRIKNNLLLKREDLQPVFSFKLRGAYNKMAGLPRARLAKGVIAASAGNHAQGVALAAQRLGCRAVIVMPVTTPRIKVNAVAARGAQVVLHGDSYDAAYAHAKRLQRRRRLTFVHPYNDPEVIAGQGTIGLEILRQHPRPIDAIFVPVGGGGLISGIAAYVKKINPRIRIIGVEPADADAMTRSLKTGRRVRLDQVGLFADGVAVKEVGEETFRLCRELVDEMILVDTDEICAAIKDVFDDTRSIMEPAGALAVAGLKTWTAGKRPTGKLAAVLSGANMNFDRLRFVAERAELGEAREAIFAVTIPERPGAFREFCARLGPRVVTEFNYRLGSRDQAHIFVGVATASREDAADLARSLNESGSATIDLSGNEMAKLHVRHMVGGRARDVRHERPCRFEFPERPGALMQFLDAVGGRWNISLFHYRNHGADFGRVLAAFEVPDDQLTEFRAFLDQLGYPYLAEFGNEAYRLFLE